MISFSDHLSESLQINASRKAFQQLSGDARYAIESWESTNWIGGKLEQHIKANDAIAQEIERAFAPVRAAIPGNSIKLYRGLIFDNAFTRWKEKILESWTDQKRIAEYFAGLKDYDGKPVLVKYKMHTDAEIKKYVDQFNRTGFVKIGNYKYIRSKKAAGTDLDTPNYYSIYNSRNSYLTDGDNLEQSLRFDNEMNVDHNEEIEKKLAKRTVFEKNIPKSQIIWLTNNLNSKEYIVRIR